MPLERVFHKSRSFEEAEEWDVEQQLTMTPEQRQAAARELKRRFYGDNRPDVAAAGGQLLSGHPLALSIP